MKKLIAGLIVIGLLTGVGFGLTVGNKVVASDKVILNTTILVANATTEVHMSSGSYIKNFSMRARAGDSIKLLNSSSTSDAWMTITASQEYTSPIDVEMNSGKKLYIMSITVPATMETIYWYR